MYKIFNTEKSNVSYFIKPYSPTNENIPLGMFGNVENSQVQGVKCPSVSSAQSRIFEIKSFLDKYFEKILYPIRSRVPALRIGMAGIDLSPLILIFGIKSYCF